MNLLLCIVALVAGILIGNSSHCPGWMMAVPFSAALILFIILTVVGKKRPFLPLQNYYSLLAFILFLGIGLFSSIVHRPSESNFPSSKYYFSGIVKDYQPTGNGDKLLLELTQLKIIPDPKNSSVESDKEIDVRNINAFLTLNEPSSVTYGSHVEGIASFSPFDAPGNFLNPDYQSYLKNRNIFLIGYASGEDCQMSDGPLPFSFLSLRDRLEASIESSPLARETRNFLISVLLGDKSYINASDRVMFSDAGISHIFAVSGFHVSLISVFILAVLSCVFLGGLNRWKYLVCVPLIWFYILLVGASPSTCRAGIMITIAMAALFFQRKFNPLSSLGWAFILILCFMPAAISDIGFQLSVVCVGSLIIFVSPFNFIDHRSHPRLHKLVSIVLVTIIATFSTWIICAFYFHRFSLMFLPLNIIAVPLLPIFIAIALVFLVFNAMGITLSFLGRILDNAYGWFMRTTEYVTNISLPFDNLYPGVLPVVLWLAGIGIAAYIVYYGKSKNWIWAPVGFLAASLAFFIFLPSSDLPSGFIIQKNNDLCSFACYENGNETLLELPPGNSVFTEISGRKILAIHSSELSQETIEKIPQADYIILGGRCRKLPEEIIQSMNSNCSLVTHPTLHWRNERSLLAEAESYGIKAHSLRYDGPLHCFFS